MKLFLPLLFWVALLIPTSAKPRIALVDMDAVFQGYDRKQAIQENVQAQIEALKNSPQVEAVQKLDARLKELADIVRDKKKNEKVREEAAEEFNSLSLEYQSLVQEMEEYLQAENRKATLRLVEAVEAITVEVQAVAQELGKENNYDLVIETSGKTSSQISPLVYLRESTDITEVVLTRLNAATKGNDSSEDKE